MNEDIKRCCMLCEYFRPLIPVDWKQGMDEAWRQEHYDRAEVTKQIRAKNLHAAGKCTLYPNHVDVHTGHSCGQFVPDSPTLRAFIWKEAARDRIDAERSMRIGTLEQQVKMLREQSRKRLTRIQQLAGKRADNGRVR